MTTERKSHIWEKEPYEHYVEPSWCSERLFQVEKFRGYIHDPCCGFGTIPEAAGKRGLVASGCDIVDRGWSLGGIEDFYKTTKRQDNIVCNPPFDDPGAWVYHALKIAKDKVAIIFPVARLNAAGWIAPTPLRRVWLLTPRPSMPPGSYITAGNKPQGGRVDFCWLVFQRGYTGPPEMSWLRRD